MFSELTESAAMGFSMVCVMLYAVYTTAENEFRTIVFLIFDASCWHKKLPYVTKDETTWYFIQFILPHLPDLNNLINSALYLITHNKNERTFHVYIGEHFYNEWHIYTMQIMSWNMVIFKKVQSLKMQFTLITHAAYWKDMIFHPVHYRDKGLQSRGLF